MNKLEVGMWVRTDKGYIARAEEIIRNYTNGKRLVNSYTTFEKIYKFKRGDYDKPN